MKPILFSLVLMVLYSACDSTCEKDYKIGELVRIPVQFTGFTLIEIDQMHVYRVDRNNTKQVDSFLLRNILQLPESQSTNVKLTDMSRDGKSDSFGWYGSYLNNCDLILDWHTGRDTLSNFVIKKSRKEIDGCHKDDPNIRIDEFSYFFRGRQVLKNESIEIEK